MRYDTTTRTDPLIIIITAASTKRYYRMATVVQHRTVSI